MPKNPSGSTNVPNSYIRRDTGLRGVLTSTKMLLVPRNATDGGHAERPLDRREVLVVGKYVSGLATSIVLFTATTVVAMLLLYFPHFYTLSMRFFTEGKGLSQLLTYAGITILACVGYGAFFLVVGLFVRNPIIPAVLLYGWEWLNFLLPPLLKKVSVIHYLNSLVPVPISEGPFAVVAEPTPAWIAVPSMLVVTIIVLVIAAYRIRHMEIRYGSD
jgi:hypothetical protein